ncbi:hypothetical protein AVEN_57888-1, partial [Araneus ventricosus]
GESLEVSISRQEYVTVLYSDLAAPSPSFHATPTGGRLATAYDLACSRPHTRRIFGGVGSRTWSPQTPKPRPYQ